MSKHTPGEWKADLHGKGRKNPGVWRVCAVRTIGADRYLEPLANILRGATEETKATACLIAAAPDLLAACNAILVPDEDGDLKYEVREERDPDGYPAGLVRLMISLDELDAIRAAVVKATTH